jgi:hypothetical protein
VQCTTDESCLAAAYTPGVCLAGDCPDADAVVWVSQESGCSDAGTGTPTAPFCGLQPAVDYVKGTAAAPRIIVVKPGAAPYGHVTVGGATLTLTIVGHLGTAVTVAGDAAHPALSVTSGATLTLRRLDFAGGSPAVVSCDSATCALDQTEIAGGALGVLATRALMLTLTRSAVHDNSAGGLSASQSDFVIENDFFYVNGAYAASVGGVTVASVPPGATARIVNNTFFSNLAAGAGAGVSCSPAGVGIVNSIVWQNLMAGAAPSSVTGCTVTYTLVDDAAIAGIAGANNLGPPVAPSFKAGTVPPYDLHLVAGSGGLCAGDATTAPTIDYDGEPRPTSCIDLGADQYSQ